MGEPTQVDRGVTGMTMDHSFSLPGSTAKGVLLLHGLAGAPGEMKFLAKRLHQQGFSIQVPQLAGHGADMATLLRTGWRDWLASAREAYRAFACQVDRVYVAGICVGGALGLALAAEQPGIAGAAVWSMTFEYDGWNMPRWGIAAPLIQYFANLPLIRRISVAEPYPFGLKDERLRRRVAEAPDSFIEGALMRLPFGSLWHMYRLGRHVERIGRTIRVPTLILHAREDDMSSPRNAWRLRAALGGPADVRLLEDSYHMIHVDRERDLVARLTAEFFGAPGRHLRADVTAEARCLTAA
jgi:carboxylesterase